MTEEEAKKALFQIHYEYMLNPPKIRLKLYDEYQRKRNEIKEALAASMSTNYEFGKDTQSKLNK